jgi:hypothetical protein
MIFPPSKMEHHLIRAALSVMQSVHGFMGIAWGGQADRLISTTHWFEAPQRFVLGLWQKCHVMSVILLGKWPT